MLIRCNYDCNVTESKGCSQRAKDPEKKKDLGQVHKVYQRYIDTNKKSKD